MSAYNIIVSHAHIKVTATYDFQSDDQGLPGFWIGRVSATFDDQDMMVERRGRGRWRAKLMATQAFAELALDLFPPEFLETKVG